MNAPRERQAQLRAAAEIKALKKANPNMTKEEEKKYSQQALTKYRKQVGSVARRDRSIKITDREWEAIQAGAISENQLIKILKNSDADELRKRATPKASTTLSDAQISRIKSMQASGRYTTAEIASKLGVSPSTVSNYMKGA